MAIADSEEVLVAIADVRKQEVAVLVGLAQVAGCVTFACSIRVSDIAEAL